MVYKKLIVFVFILAGVAFFYTIYWFAIAENLRSIVKDRIDQSLERDVFASYREFDIKGFPFYFQLKTLQNILQMYNYK